MRCHSFESNTLRHDVHVRQIQLAATVRKTATPRGFWRFKSSHMHQVCLHASCVWGGEAAISLAPIRRELARSNALSWVVRNNFELAIDLLTRSAVICKCNDDSSQSRLYTGGRPNAACRTYVIARRSSVTGFHLPSEPIGQRVFSFVALVRDSSAVGDSA